MEATPCTEKLPSDVATVIKEVEPNNAAYSNVLKDKHIALECAEKSALAKVEKIRQQKAALSKGYKMDKVEAMNSKEALPSSTPPAVAQGSVDEMNVTPGRKTRKQDQPPEELEYSIRTDESWSQIGTEGAPSPLQSP